MDGLYVLKEMGLILYRCSNDFPDKIPGILTAMSPPLICEGGQEIGAESDSSFRYTVTREKARILIFGGSEDGVMMVSIVDGSRSFFGVRARMELAADVTRTLMEAGMKKITVEELEELDAQQRKKEAEQAGTSNGG